MNEELTWPSLLNPRGTCREEAAKDRSAPPSRWFLRSILSLKLLTGWLLLGSASVVGIDEPAPSSSAPHECHEYLAVAGQIENICLSGTDDAVVAGEQLRLCQDQQLVESLMTSIENQHAAIATRLEQLKQQYLSQGTDEWPVRAWRMFAYGLVWSYRQMAFLDDYWRIGSMESTLLIAYSKLRVSRASSTVHDLSDHCPLRATDFG